VTDPLGVLFDRVRRRPLLVAAEAVARPSCLAGQLFGVRTGLAAGCVGVLSSPVWTIVLGGGLLRRGVRIDAPAGGSGTVS